MTKNNPSPEKLKRLTGLLKTKYSAMGEDWKAGYKWLISKYKLAKGSFNRSVGTAQYLAKHGFEGTLQLSPPYTESTQARISRARIMHDQFEAGADKAWDDLLDIDNNVEDSENPSGKVTLANLYQSARFHAANAAAPIYESRGTADPQQLTRDFAEFAQVNGLDKYGKPVQKSVKERYATTWWRAASKGFGAVTDQSNPVPHAIIAAKMESAGKRLGEADRKSGRSERYNADLEDLARNKFPMYPQFVGSFVGGYDMGYRPQAYGATTDRSNPSKTAKAAAAGAIKGVAKSVAKRLTNPATLDKAISAAAHDATHKVKFSDWWRHYKASNKDAANLGQEETVQIVQTWNDRAWGNEGVSRGNPRNSKNPHAFDFAVGDTFAPLISGGVIKPSSILVLHRNSDGHTLRVKVSDVDKFNEPTKIDVWQEFDRNIDIRANPIASRKGAKPDKNIDLIFTGVSGYRYSEKLLLRYVNAETESEQLARYHPNGRKHNPESAAASMFETFHGEPSSEVITVTERVHEHHDLTVLGDLRELVIYTTTGYKLEKVWDDKDGGDLLKVPKLCCNEEGTQLYIRGGEQCINLAKIKMNGPFQVKDRMLIGECMLVTYRTRKSFDKFKDIDYFHKLGEETKERPSIVYDPVSQLLEFVGGEYHIDKPLVGVSDGIIN